MPLFLSLIVAALAWSLLGSGRSGYLNIVLASLGFSFRIDMQSVAGIAFIHGLYYVPFPFLYIYGALTLIHPDLEEAAGIHGANLARTLRHITLPSIRPAVVGSGLLLLVLMAEEFPVPQILGGPRGIETLSIHIFNLMRQVPAAANQASAVCMVLTAIVALLVVGMFLDSTTAILVIAPIIAKPLVAAGVDPVHLGMVVVFNLMIGLVTPPMGLSLYLVADIAKVKMKEVLREMLPFYIPLVITLLLITYVPWITTSVPQYFVGR